VVGSGAVVGGSDGAMLGDGSLGRGPPPAQAVPEPSESIGIEMRMTAMRASPFVRTSFICAVAG